MGKEVSGENQSPDVLVITFNETAQRLRWAKLIKNKFRQNAQVRKLESELFELSEKIIDKTNCRTLLTAALLPPSARPLIKISEHIEYQHEDDERSAAIHRAFYSLLEPYQHADEETKKMLERISFDPEEYLQILLEQVPNIARMPFIFNIYQRFNWTPPLNKKSSEATPPR